MVKESESKTRANEEMVRVKTAFKFENVMRDPMRESLSLSPPPCL